MLVDSDPRPVSTRLPAWSTVLAVVAHPDDESFGLGAILDAFHRAGTRTAVLCLTRGEASTLHGAAGELSAVRGREFAAAARTLGVTDTVLRDFPDGALADVCRSRLVGEVIDAARAVRADGLLVFDPSGVTGHPDHAAATDAALLAAAGFGPARAGLDVAGRGRGSAEPGAGHRIRRPPGRRDRHRVGGGPGPADRRLRCPCEPSHPHQRAVAAPGTPRRHRVSALVVQPAGRTRASEAERGNR